jgi:hypothetical protein
VRTGPKGLPMPKYIHRPCITRKKTIDLPDLFSWRSVAVHRPGSRAAQFVMRRYGVTPHTAETIVSLAGLGTDREAAR